MVKLVLGQRLLLFDHRSLPRRVELGQRFGRLGVEQVEAVPELNPGPDDGGPRHRSSVRGWAFGVAAPANLRPFERSVGAELPKINAPAEPVVGVLAHHELAAREDLLCYTRVAAMVAGYEALIMHG